LDNKLVADFKDDIIEKMLKEGLEVKGAYSLIAEKARKYGYFDENEEEFKKAKELVAGEMETEIIVPGGGVLNEKHRNKWYAGPRTDDLFWSSLKQYLSDQKEWPERTVESIDKSSTDIISLLDNPGLDSFTTRGLVLGYIQSGKTANMTAVIAKAADVYFRFFIILSGMSNALRHQTQIRLEQDLVKQLPPEKFHLWTSSESDFIAEQSAFPAFSNDQIHMAIVKKNTHVLGRLLEMIEATPPPIFKKCPVLIIDDECDYASVNGAPYLEEMTAINEKIRRMLEIIPRTAYIGYTATPFANVLINPLSISPEHPDDLYPKDFIYSLPEPEEYFGAEKLFGRDLIDGDEIEPDQEGLDMIRLIPFEEVENLRPLKRDEKETFNFEMTETLEEAIWYYLMVTAARMVREGKPEHSSMLVHTTVYSAPHFSAKECIINYLRRLQSKMQKGEDNLYRSMESIWTREMDRVDPTRFSNKPVSFSEIREHLLRVTESVSVVVENSLSEEGLDFSNPGQRYIVVGGNVLARGLTIEGLSVSYFLRTSSQYDSLMQMGRWFGYRRDYEDLPRIWMASDMVQSFHDLATVEHEIREEIKIYSRDELTPMEFAVRIRQIPGMAITGRNKMLSAREVKISYSDIHIQTTRFKHENRGWLENNWNAGCDLIDSALESDCEKGETDKGTVLYKVPSGIIMEFLENYQAHETHSDFQSEKIYEYIRDQNEKLDELTYWNIGVIEKRRGEESQLPMGSLGKVKMSIRARLRNLTSSGDADIKALMSRRDIFIDLEDRISADDSWPALRRRRDELTDGTPLILLYPVEAQSKPSRSRNREALEADMDVLGVGVVFPKSDDPGQSYVQVELPEVEYEELEMPEEE